MLGAWDSTFLPLSMQVLLGTMTIMTGNDKKDLQMIPVPEAFYCKCSDSVTLVMIQAISISLSFLLRVTSCQ